jgi:hypothetical protein
MSHEEDPVLRNSRREAIIILVVWALATVYCCGYYALFGYGPPGGTRGPEDLHPILGMPSWFFWGVFVPWFACGAFTIWFAGCYMKDDDLGADHAAELDADILEEGLRDG